VQRHDIAMMIASTSIAPSMAGSTIFKSSGGFDEAAVTEVGFPTGLNGEPSVQFDWHPLETKQLLKISNVQPCWSADCHTMIQGNRRIWRSVSIQARKSTNMDGLPINTAADST
jgi:hypothetical protein